jgi:hypothetical protein
MPVLRVLSAAAAAAVMLKDYLYRVANAEIMWSHNDGRDMHTKIRQAASSLPHKANLGTTCCVHPNGCSCSLHTLWQVHSQRLNFKRLCGI